MGCMIATTSHEVGGGADMKAEDQVPTLVFAFIFMAFQGKVLLKNARSVCVLMRYNSSQELPDARLIKLFESTIKKPQLALKAALDKSQQRVESNFRRRGMDIVVPF